MSPQRFGYWHRVQAGNRQICLSSTTRLFFELLSPETEIRSVQDGDSRAEQKNNPAPLSHAIY
jgi:hypothetical protein